MLWGKLMLIVLTNNEHDILIEGGTIFSSEPRYTSCSLSGACRMLLNFGPYELNMRSNFGVSKPET